MPLKAIFLGSLGTLAETSELRRRALQAARAEVGAECSAAMAEPDTVSPRHRGHTHPFDLAHDRVPPAAAMRIRLRQKQIFREFLGQVRMPPRPSLKRLIDAAKGADLQLALVTTAEPEDVDAMLAVTGFDRSTFSFVGDAESVPARKPAPDIYLAALDRLSITPAEALAVEETAESAEAARALGIHCVSFPGALRVSRRRGAAPHMGRWAGPRVIAEPRLARRA